MGMEGDGAWPRRSGETGGCRQGTEGFSPRVGRRVWQSALGSGLTSRRGDQGWGQAWKGVAAHVR